MVKRMARIMPTMGDRKIKVTGLIQPWRMRALKPDRATAGPKTKAAMKFQKAAQATARKGVSTRVETTVAMELAASCQPFENSKARVRAMTTTRREKLGTGGRPGE